MHSRWASPRVRSALKQLEEDRHRLARTYAELAASYEDGAAYGKDSWLAAKHYEHFAEHLSKYDPSTVTFTIADIADLSMMRVEGIRRRNWLKWRRFLRRPTS